MCIIILINTAFRKSKKNYKKQFEKKFKRINELFFNNYEN